MTDEKTTFKTQTKSFSDNVELVYSLLGFDRIILNVAIEEIEGLQKRLHEGNIVKDHPKYGVANTLKNLRNIRENDSLKLRYESMFNQCVVLLVSYLESTLGSVFETALGKTILEGSAITGSNDEFKLTLSEIHELLKSPAEVIGEIVAESKQIGFQNFKAGIDHFKRFFGLEFQEKNVETNNVILAEACRHCIVHNAGIFDERSMKQILSAVPRTLKDNIMEGDRVQFSREEVRLVGDSMKVFFETLTSKLEIVLDRA